MKITLHLQATPEPHYYRNWMAHYSGEGSARIAELFGDATLPTAFTEHSKPLDVLRKIQRLNPDATVELARS